MDQELNRPSTWQINWDRLGMGLSLLCAIHCLITPLIILSVPLMARYYMAHPLFHLLLALLIVPVGVYAFAHGFKYHRNLWVLVLGIPGLLIITGVPYVVHQWLWPWPEALIVSIGSALLILAHWINRRTCHECSDFPHQSH